MIKMWYYTFPIYNNLTIVCWHAINRLPHLPCSGGLRLDELDFDGVGYVFLAHCLVRSIQGLLQSCIWLGALFLGPDRHEPFLGEEEKNGTHQPARPHDKHARHVFDRSKVKGFKKIVFCGIFFLTLTQSGSNFTHRDCKEDFGRKLFQEHGFFSFLAAILHFTQ